MFHIGQRVVCVRGDWRHPLLHLVPNLPIEKRIYTIRWIVRYRDCDPYGLVFEEFTNPPCEETGVEPAFNHNHFRPVIDRKTDISIFTELLTPSRPRVLEQI